MKMVVYVDIGLRTAALSGYQLHPEQKKTSYVGDYRKAGAFSLWAEKKQKGARHDQVVNNLQDSYKIQFGSNEEIHSQSCSCVPGKQGVEGAVARDLGLRYLSSMDPSDSKAF